MHRPRPIAALATAALLLAACEKDAESTAKTAPEPTARESTESPGEAAPEPAARPTPTDDALAPSGGEPPPAPTATGETAAPAAAPRPPTAEEFAAIVGALGCPEPDLVPGIGCAACPTHPRLPDGGARFETEVEVFVGRFVAGPNPSAFAVVRGCSDRAGGENLDFVLAHDGEAWSVASAADYGWNDTRRCVFPTTSEGLHNRLCANFWGQQGCYDVLLDFVPPSAASQGKLDGVPLKLDECSENEIVWGAVADIDGDDDEDVAATINGTAGLLVQDPGGFVWEAEE